MACSVSWTEHGLPSQLALAIHKLYASASSPDNDKQSVVVTLDDGLYLSSAFEDGLSSAQGEGQPIGKLSLGRLDVNQTAYSS